MAIQGQEGNTGQAHYVACLIIHVYARDDPTGRWSGFKLLEKGRY
jgi:hypothetical protein